MNSPASAAESPRVAPASADFSHIPMLYRDPSFWGMTVTQFLGAFNDNLYKQLVLLLSIVPIGFDQIGYLPGTALLVFGAPLMLSTITPNIAPMLVMLAVSAVELGQASDRQGLANTVFAVPFILTTGYAGYLSDRFGKRGIVVWCKVAEIAVMAAGALAFISYQQNSELVWLYVVLFFMGAQSGFFGPAKYGILPEMVRPEDLPRANGLMLTTTFIAIILGTFVAGVLLDSYRDHLWIGAAVCVAIAIAGTASSLFIRKLPPSNPELKFEFSSLTVPPDMRALLRNDRPLLIALVVSSLFWLVAGMVLPAVNALGKIELGAGDKATSFLVAVVSIGIAIGGGLGGVLSGGKVDFRILRVGAFGMLVCLLILAIPTWNAAPIMARGAEGQAGGWLDQLFAGLPGMGESRQWLGYPASMGVLVILGVFTGFFAVPLQVFMQSRPPEGKKGRMIAVMNLANWGGIILAGKLYDVLARLIEANLWPRSTMFLFIALLTLPIAVFYHPKNEAL
jgi:acyl-[acyl-carrier-protein]-phospholipid O-acyltransferase/long-chain-fatty-acid--[acyl-carrier-protein] ligase